MRLLVMLVSLYFVFALDREETQLELPAEVDQNFRQEYPGVLGEVWTSEDDLYVVLFEWKEGIYEAEYTAQGEQVKLLALKEPKADSAGTAGVEPQPAMYYKNGTHKDCSVKCPIGV